ncbi:MAG: hypothetical protein Tsb009_03570 [Planctomycetaceae bacterium]
MSFDVTPFNVLMGLANWGIVFGILAAVCLVLSLLISLVVHRANGPRRVFAYLKRLGTDLVRISPRRVWALSVLTFRESIRRKALLVFIVFFLVFMFAGWFISNTNTRPELQVKVHVSFVLQAITWLILPVVLLLSCWGLPEDIKKRSLHTVVTKPARKTEIFLGRFLGFSFIGSLMLLGMGTVGYIWIVRQVPEEAQSNLICRVPIYGELAFTDTYGNPAKKGINVGDIWSFRSYIQGATNAQAIWKFENISKDRLGDQLRLESRFEAFRTHKGDQKKGLDCEIRLINNLREQTAQNLAVGSEFPELKRNLIAGNYTAASTDLERISNGLEADQIKLSRKAYERYAKGYRNFVQMLRPIEESDSAGAWVGALISATEKCASAADARQSGELAAGLRELAKPFADHAEAIGKVLVNKVAKIALFQVEEFRDPHQERIKPTVNYTVNGGDEQLQGDLFEHFVHGGRLLIAVRCLDAGQYIGMARPDLFIRTPDRRFWVGYSKAVTGIWLMSLLVIILGVTSSTFVKGPVATMLTFFILILGTGFHEFMDELVSGKVRGAGAISSGYRLVKHMNPTSQLKDVAGEQVIKAADQAFTGIVHGVFQIVPSFENFRVIPYVANGFDVPWNAALLPATLTVLAFFIPCFLLGYYSLSLRELEEK